MNHRDTETQSGELACESGPCVGLTETIIGAAIEAHPTLGPGLLESAYEAALGRELMLRGMRFQHQLLLPLTYKGEAIDVGYRLDILVEDQVIIELTTFDKVLGVYDAQRLTYLRLTGKRVGLILSFKVPVLKVGIRRRVI